METYKHSTSCDNCGNKIDFEINKGTTIKEVLPSFVCPNCGCKLVTVETMPKITFAQPPDNGRYYCPPPTIPPHNGN